MQAVQRAAGAGLYRIADDKGALLYIGESSKLASRLRSHACRQWQSSSPWFSVAAVGTTSPKYQLHELECDLIAACFEELGAVPSMQVLDGRETDGACQPASGSYFGEGVEHQEATTAHVRCLESVELKCRIAAMTWGGCWRDSAISGCPAMAFSGRSDPASRGESLNLVADGSVLELLR